MTNKTVCSLASSRFARRPELVLALAGMVALAPACKKDEPAPDAKTADAKTPDGKAAPGTKTEPGGGGTDTTKPGAPGSGVNPADQPIAPASKLQRGEVLAHVLIPNPSALLGEVKAQVVPAAQASFVDESFLRSAGSAALGARSSIAQHIDLAKPAGCALVDLTSAPAPVACIVGYTGGAAALVTDLGAEGKQADAAGHAAKFVIDGQEIYVDDLAGAAVVSNHGEVFAKAKSYLEGNMIARAGDVATDIEVVAFPSSLMKRYEKELAPVLDLMGKTKPPSTGGNKLADAIAAYGMKTNTRTLDSFKEMDQITFAMGLEPIGFVARFASFPVPGSALETQAKATAAGPLDPALLKALPTTSWFVGGFSTNVGASLDSPQVKELRTVIVDAYAEQLGKDKAAVTAAIDGFVAEQVATYDGKGAFAISHQPGTLGAITVVNSLQAGKDARAGFKAWADAFTPDAVIGADGAKYVTWSFQHDAAKVGDAAVDRWTIEPTETAKAEMRKEGGEKLATFEKRMGGLKLVINRFEHSGKVVWVVAPGSDDAYTQAAFDALATPGLASDAGLGTIVDRNPGVSGVFGLSVKGAIAWLAELVPPEEMSKIPPGLGNDLSDVFMATSISDTGSQSGEVVISQKLIDQVRALAK